ncbi:hypothetical protein Lal_00021456 [Lupinus albus]|nr:hypothetical protein Lal_00021456 [Lupinus albus]
MSRIYGVWEGSYNDLPCWMNAVQNFALGTIVRYEASRHFVADIEDPTRLIIDRVMSLCDHVLSGCLVVWVKKNLRAGAWLNQIPEEKYAQSYDEGRRYDHMTTNLAECINEVLKGSRTLPITALVRTTYYMLNLWVVDLRDEAINMIKGWHVYCKELTNVIKENQRQSTCQLVCSFSRETW